ncbi:MAG: lysophospholipase [Athalassotoga sp.]|uniref:alpha/beta hydrolase n=1 Tax=Athalassotoga sp. TaxID=2022597 RepID=UPI000CA88655|nr:alpha/beta hydrolase [Mesoaciditoga lauensis]
MESYEITLNGRKTDAFRWPASNPRAIVVIVHGLGEHVSRYDVISKEFNDAGLEMTGFDQRGHGRNPGVKGHVDRFEDFLKDLDDFIKTQKTDLPIFMLGHSLGGLIAARYNEEFQGRLKGTILSSGAFSSKNVSNMIKVMAKVFSVLSPKMAFSNGIDPKTLSRNEEVISDYTKDPLVHNKITAKLSAELFKNIEIVFEKAPYFTTPVLMLAGSHDKIVPHEGTERLFSLIASKDKELKIFDGAYHEIFCDPQYSSEFRKTIIDWIVKRI